jgi:hypothetical protein
MDLFTVAQSNGSGLAARMAAVAASLPPSDRPSLERFADRVRDDGRMSINMRQGVLLTFLLSAKHQNIYEWAEGRATRSTTKTAQEIIRERLGTFYELRIAFDSFFVRGAELRYGALNIGGVGASRYGSYCSVVKDIGAPKFQVAYLRADSLKTYMLPGPRVDGPAVEQDAAPHRERHCLAGIKHAAEVVKRLDAAWPEVLCNNDDYVEAIFVGDLAPDDIECVRMTKADHEDLYDLAFEDFRTKLRPADHLEIDTFIMTLDELAKRGIRLEVV